MNIKYLESVIRRRLCPACGAGMTREIARNVYQCDRTHCGETFDFSLLSESMINELLVIDAEKELQK